MNQPKFSKRQHYLPQFYLKGFSQDNEHVYLYDKNKGEKGEIRYQTTIQIAYENHFYTFRTKKGTKENLENFFCQFEGDAAFIINKVHKEKTITPEEKAKLALFVAFLYTRTPTFKLRTEEMHSKMSEKISRMMIKMTPKESLKKIFREREGKEFNDQEIDDLVNFATDPKKSEIKFNYPNEYWIKMMLKLGADIAPAFYKMDWLFLFANQPYAFITNDNPFLLVPPENFDRFFGVGLLTPHARKIIPLRSDMCLLMGDLEENPMVRFANTDKDFFRPVNEHLLLESEKFCFSPDKGKLQKLIKELKPFNLPKIDKIQVD